MKKEGTDRTGKPWYVESDGDIEVRVCEQCGNPVAILNTDEVQEVKKVRFFRSGMDEESLIKIGEFDVEVIREHLSNFPEPCPWCGSKGR